MVVVLGLALALTACGDDDGGGIPIEDLEDAVFGQVCERLVRCGQYTDVASCRADLILGGNLVHAVETGRVFYDPELAAACLDATENASCDRTAEENRAQIQACRDALHGTVADGGACFDDQECLSEDCVIETCTMACCPGTCGTTIAEAQIGQSCLTASCAEGSFCNAENVCAALVPVGSPCDSSDACAYGAYCNGVTCMDAPDRGQPCPDQLCGGIGDRCDANMTCVALSGRGGPCNSAFGDCARPLVCSETSMTCEDPPAIGATCSFFCATGAFCNDLGTCEAIKANGAACQGDNECTSRYCDDFAASPVCADEPVCG